MPKIEIIENHGKFRKGQVLELDDFGVGHALAFKYGRIYAGKKIETQSIAQPEMRIDHSHNQVDDKQIEIIPVEKPVSFFKRRGRKPRA